MTTNKPQTRMLDLVKSVTQATINQELQGPALEALEKAWSPCCERFENQDRWQARARHQREALSFQIARAAEAIDLTARTREHKKITGGDVQRGISAFIGMKRFTPYCPTASDIEKAFAKAA